MPRNHDITLIDLEKMLKTLLEMSSSQERYDVRREPVMFRIESSTLMVVIEGKRRPQKFVVTDMRIEDNSLTVVITPEFEELEGFNGNVRQ